MDSPKKFFKNKRSVLFIIARCLFACGVAFFLYKIRLDYIESIFYDLRVTYRPFHQFSDKVRTVLIGPETGEVFKGSPTFKAHAEFLDKIRELQPKAVVYVISLADIKGTDEEKAMFAQAAAKFQHFYFSTEQLEIKGALESIRFEPPLEKIVVIPGPKTSDSNKLAKDSVTRRMVLKFQGQLFLHPIVASLYNSDLLDVDKIRGRFTLYDSDQALINFLPLGTIPNFAFEKFFEQPGVSKDQIEDRIVVVGLNTNLDSKDYAMTPMARDLNIMPLAEVHANMFETMITNSAPVHAPDWLNLILTSLISILTIHVVLTMKPLKGILVLASTSLIFSIFAYLAFWPFGIWVDMAHSFLAIFLCYYFFIPYRLIVENRRSWEYYQKHKLLTEVEELKTNFIGMMSHDLKTPLARIQGMTEIISKDVTHLSSTQQEALDMIRQSSVDLTKFISTILNYAKIESQGVELHLQSKDINQLLQEVAKKHEFLASVKHIKIVLEFDTLFSIPVDPELIKQVFSNLIENAIKYSPENSKVLVSTEEQNNRVIVQIADQGIGISAEELPHIFMKFFRSREAKTSPIKGSGLGLYLAKYFVELHKGKIFVESTPGQGSTFTVELPISTS